MKGRIISGVSGLLVLFLLFPVLTLVFPAVATHLHTFDGWSLLALPAKLLRLMDDRDVILLACFVVQNNKGSTISIRSSIAKWNASVYLNISCLLKPFVEEVFDRLDVGQGI